MKRLDPKVQRLEELKEMLASYRLMTVEDAEATGWGDLELELEGEIWRLEQELLDQTTRHPKAA
jgi:hypothetical protein